MQIPNQQILSLFVSDPHEITEKLKLVKAYLFDWDGVFNGGEKKENGSSSFSEIDAMGTNLLRFNHYLLTGETPVVAIVTGERNEYALTLAKREHFHSVYFKIKHKIAALDHLCDQYNLQHKDVAFFFDDVLDLSVASVAAARFLIKQHNSPLMEKYIKENGMADYISAHDGSEHGFRESVELIMGLGGKYDEVLDQRIQFSDVYQSYLTERNKPEPQLYTADQSGKIILEK